MSKNKFIILFASRLVHEKWADILIEAIRKSLKNPEIFSDISWHICGDGEYRQQVEKLASDHPDSIQYFGTVSPEKLAQLYHSADLLLMPSRFLETFGLTALEALASWVPVCGFAKGGLTTFIPSQLDLDVLDPAWDLLQKVLLYQKSGAPDPIDITFYDRKQWIERLRWLVDPHQKIAIIHDYREIIWWAEHYVVTLRKALSEIGKSEYVFSYSGKTSPWKRRILFIFSLFAVQRYFQVRSFLVQKNPDTIWMHSILRYVWLWGILAIRSYTRSYPDTQILLAHHDVGLLAAYPQHITEVSQIPVDATLSAFLPGELSLLSQLKSIPKWCYIKLITYALPIHTTHTVFSAFLMPAIRAHFPDDAVILFPHPVDRDRFHP